jgi:LSD1 subclass zinc finger protein
MAKSFNCPNCGAPLDFPGGSITTVRCPFCHNTIIVPEEIRTVAKSKVEPIPPVEQVKSGPGTSGPSIPSIENLDALASMNLSDHELRKIERAKRRIIRHQIREEVHKARRG